MTAPQRAAGIITGISLLLPITLSTMAVVLLAPVLPAMMAEYRTMPSADLMVPLVLTTPALCVALLSTPAGSVGGGCRPLVDQRVAPAGRTVGRGTFAVACELDGAG